MINGAHAIIYSSNAEADRAFLRDVLKLAHVDVGGGWLIFALPPAEVAVHPGDENDVHELYLMCDNVERLISEMREHAIACTNVEDQGWGRLTHVTLPGGGRLGVYQPRHERPPQAAVASGRTARRQTAKKAPSRASGKAAHAAMKSARGAKKAAAARSRAAPKRASRSKR
jgi:hypothetical protein